MSQFDTTRDQEGRHLPHDHTADPSDRAFDPKFGLSEDFLAEDYEELHPFNEGDELETTDMVFLAARCVSLFLCLVSIVFVIVVVARGQRMKSWRLYLLVSFAILSWLALSLYQDHIDVYFVQELHRFPGPRSTYWCFRNLIHGLAIYLVLLLLAHLSDMQHRSNWLALIFTVVLIPVVYSVALLCTDLHVHPKTRNLWYIKLAVASVRTVLYNIISTILLFVMSRSFCTKRLYGTYSENRSKRVVLVARWTFAFLLIHNLVAMASYAISVIARLPSTSDVDKYVLVHNALDEAALFIAVLAVPVSYLIGSCAHCCCGMDRQQDVEMDKMDKIYQDVWTTQQGRKPADRPPQPKPPINGAPKPAVSTNPAPSTGLQNGVISRRRDQQGSNSTLNSVASVDTVGSLPSIGGGVSKNPRSTSAMEAARRKRARESYMEAVSTGSLDDTGSMTSTEPIDL